MNRSWLLLALLVLELTLCAQDEQAEKLKRLQEGLSATEAGLKVLSWTALIKGFKEGNELLNKLGEATKDVAEASGSVAEGLDRVLKIADPTEQKREADKVEPELVKKVKQIIDTSAALDQLSRKIDAIQFALIDTTDPAYRVSIEDFQRDRRAALSKLRALADAMQQNITQNEGLQGRLEELARRARAASKGLSALRDGLLRSLNLGSGIFGELIGIKAFEADELSVKCNGVASDADRKVRGIQRFLAAEKQRMANLKSNISLLDVRHLLDGSWISAAYRIGSTDVPEGRFHLQIRDGKGELTENRPSGKRSVAVNVPEGSEQLAIDRANDNATLEFLGFSPERRNWIMGQNPKPSRLVVSRQGGELKGTWSGPLLKMREERYKEGNKEKMRQVPDRLEYPTVAVTFRRS